MLQRIGVGLLLLAFAACAHQTAPADSRLESTPRHDEWVTIDSGGGRMVHAYVVYPQSNKKSGSVLVIHENRGLTDWVRSVADNLAEHGYLAIAPDMLSGAAPNGGRTSDFATSDLAREAISKLPREQVMRDLVAVSKYVRTLPSANGKLAVAGFCWGGSRTWDFANSGEKVSASFVFYGGGPRDDAGVANINAPVYGFYGGNDERVNSTIEPSKAAMEKRGLTFEPVIYPGAGHAFMRLGEEPNAEKANVDARGEAWVRWLRLLPVIK